MLRVFTRHYLIKQFYHNIKKFKLVSLLLLTVLYVANSQSWQPHAAGKLSSNNRVFGLSVVNKDVVWGTIFSTNNFSSIPLSYIPKLIRTTDGGTTWNVTDITAAKGRISSDIWGVDDKTAFITTQDLGNGSGRNVLKTTDGGITWVNKYTNIAAGVWIRFFNANDGIVINGQSMATTSDGGENWIPVSAANIPAFGADEYTLIVGGNLSCQVKGDHVWFGTSNGRVYHSSDKGYNWTVTATNLGFTATISALDFRDTQLGIAVSASGRLSVTSDGGTTWKLQNSTPSLAFSALSFVDGTDSSLIATSTTYNTLGLSAYSTNFGRTWKTIPNSFRAGPVSFISPTIGWAARAIVFTVTDPALYKFLGNTFVDAPEIPMLEQFLVWPNPARDLLYFSTEAALSGKPATATIVNTAGQIVFTQQTSTNYFNISTLPAGCYFLKVEIGGKTGVEAVIKE